MSIPTVDKLMQVQEWGANSKCERIYVFFFGFSHIHATRDRFWFAVEETDPFSLLVTVMPLWGWRRLW